MKNWQFASLMLMFAGFDLLAKFQQGDPDKVGERYIAFLKSEGGAQLSTHSADLFYAVRCSLLHAFGVPDADALKKLGMTGIAIAHRKEGKLGDMAGVVLVESNGDTAVLYIDAVVRTYHGAIRAYHDSLFGSGCAGPRAQFERMFDKYGTIGLL